MDWKFTLVGLLIGVLVGATGMGGGSLMTPILVLLMGFSPSVAIGTDILHGAVFKSFGAWRHHRMGTVNLHVVKWMLLGSAPLSLAGVSLAAWLERHYGKGVQDTQKEILGGALVACGIGFLVKALMRYRAPAGPLVLDRRGKAIAILIGLLGGFVVGLTSVGSGTFFGLALLVIFPIATSVVVGTDILHAALLLWVAGIGHFVAGNVDLHATAWLLLGSIPGVFVGSHIMIRLPDRALRMSLATTLFLSGYKLVNGPYGSEVVVSGLTAMAFALLVYAVVAVRARRAEKADEAAAALRRQQAGQQATQAAPAPAPVPAPAPAPVR